MSTAPLRVGKARPNLKGTSRTWSVKLYAPSGRYPHHRVAYKDPQTQQWVNRTPRRGEDPDAMFELVEQALDSLEQDAALPISEPTLADLWERYQNEDLPRKAGRRYADAAGKKRRKRSGRKSNGK